MSDEPAKGCSGSDKRGLETERRSDGINLPTLAILATAAIAAPVHKHHHKHHPYRPHDPGCRTRACDRRVDEAWADWEYEAQEPKHPYYREANTSSAGHTSLEACIIQHESGGDPNATNGSHWGIGQWDQPTWEADGGRGSPAGASLGEQEAVLRSEGEAGQRQQQAQYDGC